MLLILVLEKDRGAIQFDYQVNLKWAKELIRDSITIMGNLNYNKLVDANVNEMFEDFARSIYTTGPGGGTGSPSDARFRVRYHIKIYKP